MILQALCAYHDRLAAEGDKLPRYGFSTERIDFAILLNPEGKVVDVQDIREMDGKKPRSKPMTVPQGAKRTAGIKPNFLWDKSSYVLGVSNNSKRAADEFNAFKTMHLDVLRDAQAPGLKALAAFLTGWSPDNFQTPPFTDEMIDKNIVFRLDGVGGFIHDLDEAKVLVSSRLSGDDASEDADDDVGQQKPAKGKSKGGGKRKGKEEAEEVSARFFCLVSGAEATPSRLHPSIKGVRGAKTSGAAIVSFNQEAFTSYGKEQGSNAPISLERAAAYTTALNHLLRFGADNRQKLVVGDTTVVFWAEASAATRAEAAENLMAVLTSGATDEQEAEKVREVLEGVRKGQQLSSVNPGLEDGTRIYVLGLAPNASRLSVRFWLVDRLDSLTRKMADHYEDMALEPSAWKRPPTPYSVVLQTVPHREGAKPKMDDAFHNLAGQVLQAILSGRPYPRSLLVNTIMRIRSDGQVGARAAICKGVLARERRLFQQLNKEEIPMSLDPSSSQPGYLLGRLFAALEKIQSGALGYNVNATIRDRFYGAASATPASIFPVLLRNAQNHLAKIRKAKPGMAINLERLVLSITNLLPPEFPRVLNIEDQGRFAIGYYHQFYEYRKKAVDTSTEADDNENNHEAESGTGEE